ncbi:hypothetical protein SAMN00017405_1675 [Desulfonispora thiosulfatigenes DSM 11270]|uniref:Uncharacterized protein n=1 Tax=Desulfonispora thiosulfatigenes DSM 11270 TaxID=656914 RepID=A0A1W1UYH8_DESTI|nr:hypothetical protein [Desulfonispora thiosulfatigenes]SMB85801.1 hypothetical protein SAMN00017405_1675 [Desulfonispora thiosulfatigenes DSM 11270]
MERGKYVVKRCLTMLVLVLMCLFITVTAYASGGKQLKIDEVKRIGLVTQDYEREQFMLSLYR